MKRISNKEAFGLIWEGIKGLAINAGIAMKDAAIWCGLWVMNHKLLTALVISIALNIGQLLIHMQDAQCRETQNYTYWQLEEKYDSLRMANIKYMK